MSRSILPTRAAPLRPIGLAVAGSLAMAVCTAAPTARAQADDAVARADAAFKEGQRLHAAGDDAAACPKFEESKRLAPAVGVTLHLADCYAKTGRTASAWKEFREAEKMARDKGDKRAALAGQRAAALAPNLSRLTVEAPADAAKAGEQIQLDGAPLASEAWNVAQPVDPGDHVIVVTNPGQPARTLSAHVDPGGASATLSTGLSSGQTPAFVLAPSPSPSPSPSTSTTTTTSTPTSESAPAAATSPSPEPARSPSDHGTSARWIAGGLIGVGLVGAGIGTWLVTYKTQDMVGGQLCDPHLQPHAVPEAAVAFSVGGVALLSGAALFLANWPGRAEVSLAPSVGPGGAGTVLKGRF